LANLKVSGNKRPGKNKFLALEGGKQGTELLVSFFLIRVEKSRPNSHFLINLKNPGYRGPFKYNGRTSPQIRNRVSFCAFSKKELIFWVLGGRAFGIQS